MLEVRSSTRWPFVRGKKKTFIFSSPCSTLFSSCLASFRFDHHILTTSCYRWLFCLPFSHYSGRPPVKLQTRILLQAAAVIITTCTTSPVVSLVEVCPVSAVVQDQGLHRPHPHPRPRRRPGQVWPVPPQALALLQRPIWLCQGPHLRHLEMKLTLQ